MHTPVAAEGHAGAGAPSGASGAILDVCLRHYGGPRHHGGVAVAPLSRGGGCGVRGGEGRAAPGGLAPAPAEGPGSWTKYTVVLQLDAATATSFFGVYDDHGGPAVSRYCGKHLHVELRKHPQFRHNPITALEETFLRMDEKMRLMMAGKELSGYGGNEYWDGYREALRRQRFRLPFCEEKLPYSGPLNDGCIACVVLIRGNEIIVGNAGDSRCVLSRNNLPVVLSTDFKPDLPGERQRIENTGRAVTITEARGNIPRIDAGIAVSRSLGDLAYKNDENLPVREQAITALPEVRTEYINNDAQFLILACDGIWDCMTNQQAVDYVRINLAANAGLAFICESNLNHCIALPRGRDNMTVMLVQFNTTGAGNVPPPLQPAIIQAAGSHGAGLLPPQPLPEAIVQPAAGGQEGDQAAAEAEAWRNPKEPTSTSSDPPTPNWGSAAEGRVPLSVRGGSRSRTNSSKSSDRSWSSEL